MRKKLLLVFLIAAFLMVAAACQSKNRDDKEKNDGGKTEADGKKPGEDTPDAEDDGLMSVWLVTKESVYEVKDGKETTTVTEKLYDQYGNEAGIVEYDAEGNEVSRKEYGRFEYDSDGRLLKWFGKVTAKDEIVLYMEFLYDEQGRRSTAINHFPFLGDDVERVERKYDYYDNGCVADEYWCYKPDSLSGEELREGGFSAKWSRETEFDTKARRWTEYSCNTFKDTKVKQCEYVYNSFGEILKEYYAVTDKEYYTEYVYNEYGIRIGTKDQETGETRQLDPHDEYDAQGRVLVDYDYDVRWDGEHLKRVTEYTYDSNGNETEVVRYGVTKTEEKASSPSSRIVKTYDSANHLTRSVTYKRDDSVSATTEYSYDPAGNLILEVNYDGNGKVTYRKQSEWKEFRRPSESLITREFEILWQEAVRLGKNPW